MVLHDWLAASKGGDRATKEDVRALPFIADAIEVCLF